MHFTVICFPFAHFHLLSWRVWCNIRFPQGTKKKAKNNESKALDYAAGTSFYFSYLGLDGMFVCLFAELIDAWIVLGLLSLFAYASILRLSISTYQNWLFNQYDPSAQTVLFISVVGMR